MSDATDQLGNYNGTATNVNFNTEGKFGFAGSFNGSSSYMRLPANFLNSSTQTISAWVNPSSVSGNGYIFSSYDYQNGPSKGTYFRINSGGQIQLTVHDGDCSTMYPADPSCTSVTQLVSPSAIPTNTWTHVVGVIGGSGNPMTIYINGANVVSTATMRTVGYWAGKQPLIGATDYVVNGTSYGPEGYFNGKIDQIRIYDSALSAADVSTLYKEVECKPAAINALDHFNTVLYTGNNTTNVINTVGFEPGLLWVKTRDDNKNHVLVDTVRGISSVLEADTPAAAVTGYTDVTSFDPNGFTLAATSAVYMNPAGIDMVSWNWKAALANLSTNFNGSSSYIELAFASLNVNNNFTWSFWIKFNSFTLYDTPIGFFMNGYTNFIDLVDVNGQLSFYDGQSRLNTPGSTFATGSWYHVAVTKSSTNGRKFYVNGSEVASNSSNSNSGSSSGGRNLLGAYSSSGNPTTALLNVDGDMAQVRIFHSALTASQISDLYAEPAASNNTLNYPAGAGCIAAYPLQTNAVDLSGNYSGASSNVTFGQPGYLTQNTYGTIPSTVAANQEAGFSVVKTGTSNSNETVGHGLGLVPKLIISKPLDVSADWTVWTEGFTNLQGISLNNNAAKYTNGSFETVTSVSTTTIGLGRQMLSSIHFGGASGEIIHYIFADIAGYSKIGSYIGQTAGVTIYTGFQPRFIMVKSTSNVENWAILDAVRGSGKCLNPNLANAESDSTLNTFTTTATGFSFPHQNTADAMLNENGYEYIFLAIA
jgi:hypothetical protein